ncbi:hypothetical protein EMIHUDRAFT_223680 [Emiliania huxleyi CCMP1516]|uniref:Protein kinase domain-containing protein n=2 Tax=Emiliania huxleyi TaxID=2903 RepID=A0A0D3KTW3_EMIH1|nr:hypothetical protein EMIHUDRAFT_223680 [Emiliania huxleyi CCMP1516]EOD39198.1 hypothetical protein EMIHUDRAFT_223680 [Emiliania huxleyi CCMP1516]|eukprot:XP_005791627.1 hypothetical protein EMIHUDRAFT_223680 [Emiliania huxleyi CCMP1516]
MFSSMVSAASKLVAGANLPYELGEEYASFAGKTPWRLYAGKSRKLECDVTVFLYDIKKGTDAQTELARNAMRRYRTLKHPYCVKCLDAGELADNGLIFLLTEPVTPLADALAELSRTPSSLVWGLYTLAAAVNFLSIDCKMALEPLLRIAKDGLSEEDMQSQATSLPWPRLVATTDDPFSPLLTPSQVVPTVVKLFANTDRSMRIPLLQTLPALMEHLSARVINETVFGLASQTRHVSLGFADTSPVLRELTVKPMVAKSTVAKSLHTPSSWEQVKSMVALAPKLSRGNMGQAHSLPPPLAGKGARGAHTPRKIAVHLDASERERVLIPAFTRSLKDPFPPGRNAGLLSFSATQQYYKPIDAATRVLAAVAPMVLDPEREASAAVGKPPGEASSADADAADDAVSKAADTVLKSMNWLTSAAAKAVGAPQQCGPMGGGPMGAAAPSGGNMMNFGSAAAKPPNAFDSLDPLAMMAAGKPKKAGGAIAAKKSNDDWGDNPW